MNKSLLIFLLAGTVRAVAQEPISHDARFPEGAASWTVQIEHLKNAGDSGAASAKPRITAIEAVRIGGLRHDTVRWSDGGVTNYWWSSTPPVVLFRPKPGKPILSILPGQIGSRNFDEANFSWVGPGTFRKEDRIDGKKVREYLQEKKIEDGVVRYIAQIDVETGRPVTWSDEVIRAKFVFLDPPTAPLVMPEDFRTALQRVAGIEAPAKPMGKR